MAGKGRASVNDMKRVEVQVLMEIAQQSEDNGGFYGFSRKTLAERVGVSPYRARAAIERLESEDIIEVVSRYSDDGGQLANGICLTERGEWYLEGIRAGMLAQDLIKDEFADRLQRASIVETTPPGQPDGVLFRDGEMRLRVRKIACGARREYYNEDP